MQESEEQWNVILTHSVAEALARRPNLPLLEGVEGDWATFARYPDGSIEIPLVNGCGLYELDGILQESGLPSVFSPDNPDFDSQPPFPSSRVTVVIDEAYQRRLPQPGVNVWVAERLGPLDAPRSPLDRFRVLVLLSHRVDRETRRTFARCLYRWAESVAERGVFGEGPAFVLGDRIIFDGLAVELHVDLSRSGQATLNWLILSLLAFGRETNAVQGVVLGEITFNDFESQVLGHPAGRPVAVTVSPEPSAVTPEPPDGGPPDDAKPDPSFRSDRFAVLNTAGFQWEYAWVWLQTTIYFARTPPDEVFSELSKLLESYLTVGRYGGLGPGDLGGCSPISFDASTATASFRADMKGADREVAVPLLIRLLEQFNPTAFPIDAVVFGA